MEEQMEITVIEIHPYDLAELMYSPTMKQIGSYRNLGDEVYEWAGVRYHRNPLAARIDGPHTIV